MFLPIFYYPIQEDNRATGFLIPIYGSTTARGQSITNQFFWAINRSHDATIEHDWFSKTGQQIGGEYRYVLGPRLAGQYAHVASRTSIRYDARTRMGQRRQTPAASEATRSSATWRSGCRHNLQARANANYYTSIVDSPAI